MFSGSLERMRGFFDQPPVAAPIPLIDSMLNVIRQGTFQFPYKDLIHLADQFFNLQGLSKNELKISDEVKWQLYFATTSYQDSTGFIHMNEHDYFSVDHLSIDDLAALYAILKCYSQVHDIFVRHLFAIERRFYQLNTNTQSRDQIIAALKNQKDGDLLIMIHLTYSDDPVLEKIKKELYGDYVAYTYPSYLFMSHIIASRRILEGYLMRRPHLDLSGLGLDRLPHSIKSLPRLKTVNLENNLQSLVKNFRA